MAFTSTQVEAIRAGMNYGLTMVCLTDLIIQVKSVDLVTLLYCAFYFYANC